MGEGDWNENKRQCRSWGISKVLDGCSEWDHSFCYMRKRNRGFRSKSWSKTLLLYCWVGWVEMWQWTSWKWWNMREQKYMMVNAWIYDRNESKHSKYHTQVNRLKLFCLPIKEIKSLLTTFSRQNRLSDHVGPQVACRDQATVFTHSTENKSFFWRAGNEKPCPCATKTQTDSLRYS